jgi:hypothetical protein
MVTIRVEADSPLDPEVILAAARDFSERRPGRWPSIDPEVYRAEEVGPSHAIVMEGEKSLGGIWAREHYTWEAPGMVRAEVLDSNVFRPGSSWSLEADPRPGGGAHVVWTSRRSGKGKGRLLTLMLRLGGRKELRRRLERTLAILEAEAISRPPGAKAPEPARPAPPRPEA